MKVLRLLIPCVIAAGALAGCSHRASLGAPPVPGGGEVAGRLVAQRSDGSDRSPLNGQRVGVFTHSVPSGGPVMTNPPKPIATAVTSSDGTFHFRGLQAGRYFITVVQPSGGVSGTWVEVGDGRGAALVLVLCTNCPVPV